MPVTFTDGSDAETPSGGSTTTTSSGNNSFIATYEELFFFLEKKNIYELLTQEADDVVESLSGSLSTEQQNRLNNALNWGKDVIVAGLQERYNFDAVTSSNCPIVLKEINARLVQWALEIRRYRNAEAMTYSLADIKEDIADLAKESSIWSLSIARQTSPLGTARNSNATRFDEAGHFNVPASERDDLWPDA